MQPQAPSRSSSETNRKLIPPPPVFAAAPDSESGVNTSYKTRCSASKFPSGGSGMASSLPGSLGPDNDLSRASPATFTHAHVRPSGNAVTDLEWSAKQSYPLAYDASADLGVSSSSKIHSSLHQSSTLASSLYATAPARPLVAPPSYAAPTACDSSSSRPAMPTASGPGPVPPRPVAYPSPLRDHNSAGGSFTLAPAPAPATESSQLVYPSLPPGVTQRDLDKPSYQWLTITAKSGPSSAAASPTTPGTGVGGSWATSPAPSPDPAPLRPLTYFTLETDVSDGSIYLFGGFSDDKARSSAVHRYRQGRWSRLTCTGTLPPSMYLHSASIKDKIMYVFGGSTKVEGAVVFLLNLETLEWSSVHCSRRKSSRTGNHSAAEMAARSTSAPGVPSSHGSSASAVAVAMGAAGDDSASAAPVYPPVSRYGHTGTIVGDDLILIGGCDRTGKFLPDTYAFSLTRRTWRPLAPMPTPTAYHVAFAWRGKLYTVFGSCPGGVFATGVQCYDPAGDAWSTLPSTVEPSTGPSAAPAGSAAAAAATGTWGPPVRCGAAASVVGDVLYLFGGYSTSVHADDFWRLDLPRMSWRELPCGPPVAPGAAGGVGPGAGAGARPSLEGVKVATRTNTSSLNGSSSGKGMGAGASDDGVPQCSGAGGSEFRPLARGYCRMVAVGTKLYLYGGYDGKRCISDFRMCDVTPRVVTPLPTVPRPVSVCSVAAVAAGSLRAIINATYRFSRRGAAAAGADAATSSAAPHQSARPAAAVATATTAADSALSRFCTMINAACEPATPVAAPAQALGGAGSTCGLNAVGGPGGLCVNAGAGPEEDDDDPDDDATASIATGAGGSAPSESAASATVAPTAAAAAGAAAGSAAVGSGESSGRNKSGFGVSRVEAWQGVCAVVKAMFKRHSRSIPSSPTHAATAAGAGAACDTGVCALGGNGAGASSAPGRPSRPLSAVAVSGSSGVCPFAAAAGAGEEEDSTPATDATAAADADAGENGRSNLVSQPMSKLTSSVSSTSEGSGRSQTPAVHTASSFGTPRSGSEGPAGAVGAAAGSRGRWQAVSPAADDADPAGAATKSISAATGRDSSPATAEEASGAALAPRPSITSSKSWAEAIADVLFTTSAPPPAPEAEQYARLAPRSSHATPTAALPPPTLRAPSSATSVACLSTASSPAPSSAAPAVSLAGSVSAAAAPAPTAAAAAPAMLPLSAGSYNSGMAHPPRSPTSDDDDAELTAALSVDSLLAELPPTIPTVVAVALMHEMAAMICRSQRQQAQCWQQLCAAASEGTQGAAAAAAAMAAATGHSGITPVERFLLAQSLRGATGTAVPGETGAGTLGTACGMCGCAGSCGAGTETGGAGYADEGGNKGKKDEEGSKGKGSSNSGSGNGGKDAAAGDVAKATTCVACPSCKTNVPVPATTSATPATGAAGAKGAGSNASTHRAAPAAAAGSGCDGTCSRLQSSQSAITPAYSSPAAAAAAAAASNSTSTSGSGALVKSASEVRKKLVYPFDTSQLERLVEFGYSRDHVLQALARLYDAGKHRACAEISKVIDMLGLEPYDATRTVEPIEVVEEPDLEAELKVARHELTHSQSELKAMRERMMCQICYEGEVKVVMVPCGHLMCQSCGKQCTSSCFFCSQEVVKQQNINGI